MTINSGLAVVCAFVLALFVPRYAQSQKLSETVIFSFPGGTGGFLPLTSGVVRDSEGNFYGTTYAGGDYGSGTVFKVDPTGTQTVLYSFTGGTDGAAPSAGLVMDGVGDLFGTTYSGGIRSRSTCYHGCGVVFEIDEAGNFKTLHRFASGSDGAGPLAALVRDSDGNLYGTTQGGGAAGDGTVFKVTRDGRETVLHEFKSVDGQWPEAGVILDADGNLYGTTFTEGTDDCGTVFELERDGHEVVLHNFSRGSDGCNPEAPLLLTSDGDLYGTTFMGGGPSEGGTIFKIDKSGKEVVLHSFDGAEAYFPFSPLISDSHGNLFGTTLRGGPTNLEGSLFEITPQGAFSILFPFTPAPGAEGPTGPLLLDEHGNIYGTTGLGGAANYGTVFELSPDK